MQFVRGTDNESFECPICLEIVDRQHVRLACGHAFHMRCVFGWFKCADTCPICRHHVVRSKSDSDSDDDSLDHLYTESESEEENYCDEEL
jgi:hypothetical protein